MHGVNLSLKSNNVCEIQVTSERKDSFFFPAYSFHIFENDVKHALTRTHFALSFPINKIVCSIRNVMNKSCYIDIVSHSPA